MQQGKQFTSADRTEGPASGVSRLAAEVVARLVARDGADTAALREPLLVRLMEAVIAPDLRPLEGVRAEFRRARISAAEIADVYIPEVARRLGQCWTDDQLSFASVTMGTARLQAVLREIGTDWTADAHGAADGPGLLLLVPPGEQHTLGLMLLAGRLRRMGVSVCLRFAADPAAAAKLVSDGAFRGVLISVSGESRLAACSNLIKALKHSGNGSLLVAIGGAILDEAEEEMRSTGADLVTNDIDHVLRAMGIVIGNMPVLESS
ncbi:cobalamin B12-binding domain-containing protein [Paragemmobacter ruber]|uniref:B12-binding domain-containing protein n=1 Tax=Paragemmobacter ruber TaxID=1985673 RepID=A0ABW9Y8Z0_9RHOB|nr:cobalamin-dependent protein [Rhodobacter ruber]NBE08269.1 hypothetical protein [Rhodobacter ruber]